MSNYTLRVFLIAMTWGLLVSAYRGTDPFANAIGQWLVYSAAFAVFIGARFAIKRLLKLHTAE